MVVGAEVVVVGVILAELFATAVFTESLVRGEEGKGGGMVVLDKVFAVEFVNVWKVSDNDGSDIAVVELLFMLSVDKALLSCREMVKKLIKFGVS